MYYQNYDDYMRSVLGYPMERANTYETYPYTVASFENTQVYSNTPRYSDEIMKLYPEIYRIVNPMVCKICDSNTEPITCELVDQMTDEIYRNLEVQHEMDTIINARTSSQNSTSSMSSNRTTKEKEHKELKETEEISRGDRQRSPNNSILRDLIRILILNQLLGRTFSNSQHFRPIPQRIPMRPPFPRENRLYENYF